MKRLQKLTNKCPLKTFFIGSLTAATVLHLFEKRYNSPNSVGGGGTRRAPFAPPFADEIK
jgi:hypothetical protein